MKRITVGIKLTDGSIYAETLKDAIMQAVAGDKTEINVPNDAYIDDNIILPWNTDIKIRGPGRIVFTDNDINAGINVWEKSSLMFEDIRIFGRESNPNTFITINGNNAYCCTKNVTTTCNFSVHNRATLEVFDTNMRSENPIFVDRANAYIIESEINFGTIGIHAVHNANVWCDKVATNALDDGAVNSHIASEFMSKVRLFNHDFGPNLSNSTVIIVNGAVVESLFTLLQLGMTTKVINGGKYIRI
jgi:hypothetical protein